MSVYVQRSGDNNHIHFGCNDGTCDVLIVFWKTIEVYGTED